MARVHTWMTGERLTSAQMNAVDQKLSNVEQAASYGISGSGVASTGTLTLTETHDVDSSYGLSSNVITVPAAGIYLVTLCARMSSTDATNPLFLAIALKKASTAIYSTGHYRFSTDTGLSMPLSGHHVVTITTPGSEGLSLINDTSATATIFTTLSASRLTIRRLS